MTDKTLLLLPHLLSPDECRSWIDHLEGQGFHPTGGDYPPTYRDNDRLVIDDEPLSQRLFDQFRHLLPSTLEHSGSHWRLSGLNSRFRSCRYQQGQAFTRHRDGAHAEGEGRRSLLTLMLYLNDGAEFQGGSTRFYPDRWSPEAERNIRPQAGLGIIFDHAYWHDGQAVSEGTKYVLRTDVMYESEPTTSGHTGYVFDIVEMSDGRVASGSRDRTVRVWSQDSVRILSHHRNSVTCLASVSGRLWSGSRDREIAIWNRDLSLRRHFLAHDGTVLALLPLSNGWVASSAASGELKFWDQEGGLRREVACGRWPWALHQMPDGRLLVGDDQGQVSRVGLAGQVESLFQAPSGVLCLTQVEGTVLGGGADGRIYRWQRHGHPLPAWEGHRGPVTRLLRLSDGRLLSGSEDDGVRLWSHDGSSVELLRHDDFVRALCLVQGGRRLATGSYDGSVRWTELPGPANSPAVIARSERAANPLGASSGAAAANW